MHPWRLADYRDANIGAQLPPTSRIILNSGTPTKSSFDADVFLGDGELELPKEEVAG